MKKKKLLITIGIILAVLLVILVSFFLMRPKESMEEEPNQIVEVDKISNYDYKLEDRDTTVYKTTFEAIRECLNQEEVDYAEYAKLLSSLYIIDLYTIANKLNKYDVGGVDFILEDARENFSLKVTDTIYKYVEDNSYGKRAQKLPEVSEISEVTSQTSKVKIDNDTYEGYIVNIKWEYAEDLGYDDSAKITLILKDGKLFVTNQTVE